MKKFLIILTVTGVLSCLVTSSFSQSVVVADDETYNAHTSAMLDVHSKSKGMLVPRLTTLEMNAIVTPAVGLMIYNTSFDKFYFYSGSAWLAISGAEYFQMDGDNLYATGDGLRMGVGDVSPMSRLSVKGDPTAASDAPLFEVKNSTGDVIFGVYEDEVKINFVETTKGYKGGFAVGGLSPGKGVTNEYLRVTPDSVRIYVKDATTKGYKGGFAVGGLSPGKGFTDTYLSIQRDEARIFVDKPAPAAGYKGGFAVGGLSPGKAADFNFLDLTPDNYFIGHNAGKSITTGKYNQFIGYKAGQANTTGASNVFMGNQTGYNNTTGASNVFLGNLAGYSSNASNNVFLGNESGRYNTSGTNNAFVGYYSGRANTTGSNNVFVGNESGVNNTSGFSNIAIGYKASANNKTGYNNISLGQAAGYTGTNLQYNVFIGDSTGYSTASAYADKNIFIGYAAGRNNNSYSNVYIGDLAGYSCVTGQNNIAIGSEAGYKNQSSQNIFIGTEAGRSNTTGYFNIIMGRHAGHKITTGSQQIIIGGGAGASLTTGAENVIIGTNAGAQNNGDENIFIGNSAGWSNTGSNNIIMGHQVGYGHFQTVSNRLIIHNSSVATPLIWGEFDNRKLVFNANVSAIDVKPGNDDPAIYGEHDVTDNYGVGVKGKSRYRAVYGVATTATGSGYGIYGYASGNGTGTRYGVYGAAHGGATAWAGYFAGNVKVTGTVTKASSSSIIDHPQDPENKYLLHANVGSPDMKNIYDGVVVLDAFGRATVELPSYFGALNNEFRYQLTAIGAPAPSIYIEKEISNNQFVIAGGNPDMKISWQVTGIRKDNYAEKNRTQVEQEKLSMEKGKYLHPELFNKSEQYGVGYDSKEKEQIK